MPNDPLDPFIDSLAAALSDAGKLACVLVVIPAAFVAAGPAAVLVADWLPGVLAWLREPLGLIDALVASAVMAGYALGRLS